MAIATLAMRNSGTVFGHYERETKAQVKLGIETLLEKHLDVIRDRRLGLITNPTGVDSRLVSTIDLLFHCKEATLVALFGPEHGIRGDYFAGAKIARETDAATSLPVYSLYGETTKPTPEMLKEVDVLLYDIQDIGSRGYTYIYTMALAMQAAAEQGKTFIVLDRPDPLGGELVDGNVLNPHFSSFVGMYPIAYVYGMTPGELAQFFNQEFGINCHLRVIKMEGWRRSMKFWDTGLPWIPPSMHIVHPHTPFFCAITGFIGELQTVNEGVGYTSPFELVGAPWIDGARLARELNSRQLPGLLFRPVSYVPRYFTFKDRPCRGVQIHLVDVDSLHPAAAGIHMLEAIHHLYPEARIFEPTNAERVRMFDNVMGTDMVRQALQKGKSADQIIASWQPELQEFLQKRQHYLLYP